MNTNNLIPEQNDIDVVREALAFIQAEFYDKPMTSARRLAIGTKLRKISDEVYTSLTTDEQIALREYHRTSNPMIKFLVEQRRVDSAHRHPTYIDFAALEVLAAHHNKQLDDETTAKNTNDTLTSLEDAFT